MVRSREFVSTSREILAGQAVNCRNLTRPLGAKTAALAASNALKGQFCGRLFADGLVVMTFVSGGPPETEGDWRRVADTLRQLHRLTQGWPQRPGWRSSTDLLHAETGTKIDLGSMPAEGVARCRVAWERLTGRQTCVVHGNPTTPGNVRVTADRVALIDWDESHVDVPDLDLALPHNAAGLDDSAHDIAAQASAAWEAAVCWEDDYAVKRLAEVRAV